MLNKPRVYIMLGVAPQGRKAQLGSFGPDMTETDVQTVGRKGRPTDDVQTAFSLHICMSTYFNYFFWVVTSATSFASRLAPSTHHHLQHRSAAAAIQLRWSRHNPASTS